MDKKKLYRTEGKDKMLCGVCGGLAEYFDLDPTIVRVLWAVITAFAGFGLVLYIICALIVPAKSTVYPGY